MRTEGIKRVIKGKSIDRFPHFSHMQIYVRRLDSQTDRDVFGFHSFASNVLIGDVFNLLEEHPRVVHAVDHDVDAVRDTQQMCLELGAVRMLHIYTAEQCLRLRVALENSAICSTNLPCYGNQQAPHVKQQVMSRKGAHFQDWSLGDRS